MSERLAEQEDRNADVSRAKKKVEADVENLKKNVQDLELGLRKADAEKQSKDHQIRQVSFDH